MPLAPPLLFDEANGEQVVNPASLIQNSRPLSSAGHDELSSLAKRSRVLLFEKASTVARSGDRQAEVLLIADGQIELFAENREACTRFMIGVLERGALLGGRRVHGWSILGVLGRR